MKKVLVIVDMQKDFIDGSLGSPDGPAVAEAAAEKIRSFEGIIFATLDTHLENYLETSEGKKLPVPHCIKGTPGWQLDRRIAAALEGKTYTCLEKPTFGNLALPKLIRRAVAGDEELEIELIGRCTDICVVSNALILKSAFPEAKISVDSACCSGVSPETHRAALDIMNCCQIDIK